METILTVGIIAGILVVVFFLIKRGGGGSGGRLRGGTNGTDTGERREDTNKQ